MQKLRWGILSAGRIAQQFAQDLAHVDNGELVAVAARTGEAATAFAQRYRIPHAHTGYAALYADSRVDVISFATPHSLHFTHSSAALAAGKAVLCEKPLTISLAESTALIDIARRRGHYLVEGLWTYFLPAIRQAQRWVDDGRIGRIRHIKADF